MFNRLKSLQQECHVPLHVIVLLTVALVFGQTLLPYAQETTTSSEVEFDAGDSDATTPEDSGDLTAYDSAAKPKPVIPNLIGNWHGIITGPHLGTGTIEFSISQNKRALKGAFVQHFAGGAISSIVGTFTGNLSAKNAIKLSLKASNLKGCTEKIAAQLNDNSAFGGSFNTSKKCGADRGSFSVNNLPPATPTATATATPTMTATLTQTPTATATAPPLEVKSSVILPPPPIAIDPPAPAAGSTVSISVTYPQASNISLAVAGDGCGSLQNQSVAAAMLTESQSVGSFGQCVLSAEIETPNGEVSRQSSFVVQPSHLQLPALKIVDGDFVPGSLPDASGTANDPMIASVDLPPTLINGGSGQLKINLLDPSQAANIASVLVQIQGAGGDAGYFVVPATVQGNVITVNLQLDQSFGQGSFTAQSSHRFKTLTLPPSGKKDASTARRMVTLDVSGIQIVVQLLNTFGAYGNKITQAVNTALAGTGNIQVSVSWDSPVDLDLHLVEPTSEEIYYGHSVSSEGGALDVDSNPGCFIDNIDNENINYANGSPPSGQYTVRVDFFDSCNNLGTNYTVTTNVCGQKQTFNGSFAPSDADFGSAGSGRTITTFNFASGCQYEVSGQALYEKFAQTAKGLSTDSTMMPIRYAKVQVLRASDNQPLCSGQTDPDTNLPLCGGDTDQAGNFDIKFQNSGTPGYYVVVMTTQNRKSLKQTVHNNTGKTYQFRSPGTIDETAHPNTTGLMLNVKKADGAGAFSIFDLGVSGSIFTRRYSGASPPLLDWLWTDGVATPCTCFDPRSDQISVASGTGTGNPDEYDDTVMLHEYGHFWQKYFSRKSDLAGQHSPVSRVATSLAWNEGSATFFGNFVNGNSLYLDTCAPAADCHDGLYTNFDINSLGATIPLGTSDGTQTGNISEAVDASVLWHMANGINAAGVFKSAKRLNTSEFFDRDSAADLLDLLDSWFCLGLGNKDLVKGYTDQVLYPYDFLNGAGCGP